MASQYKRDLEALCPFYRRESATDIRCEGLFSKFQTQNFQTGEQKDAYKMDFCRGLYTSCVYYLLKEEKELGGL